MHLDRLEATVWEFQGHEAPSTRTELYSQLARCVSRLLTWLRLASERCRGGGAAGRAHLHWRAGVPSGASRADG